jgi:hypothetical protein
VTEKVTHVSVVVSVAEATVVESESVEVSVRVSLVNEEQKRVSACSAQ